jgi:hypothetical protein
LKNPPGDLDFTLAPGQQAALAIALHTSAPETRAVALGQPALANTQLSGNQYGTQIAMDRDGDYVIAWVSIGQDGSGSGVYAQRFNAAGNRLGGEFRVNTNTSQDQDSPAIAMDDRGNFVVVWQSMGQDGFSLGIYGQRYDAAGNPMGGEFLVNTTTAGQEQAPTVTMDNEGAGRGRN